MKNLAISAALLISLSTAAAADPILTGMFGTDDVNAGTLCEVQGVTVLAQSQDDCSKIGGKATHNVTSTKTPLK